MKHAKKLKKKITEAKHMSKPDAKNTVVLYDKTGRWILEIYTVGHTVKDNRKLDLDIS